MIGALGLADGAAALGAIGFRPPAVRHRGVQAAVGDELLAQRVADLVQRCWEARLGVADSRSELANEERAGSPERVRRRERAARGVRPARPRLRRRQKHERAACCPVKP